MELTTRLPAPSNVNIKAVTLKIAVIAVSLFLIVEQDTIADDTDTTSLIASFFNETLPMIVASGLTLYASACCGYVGLVHLGWLPN